VRWDEELAAARERFGLMNFYEKFEHIVIVILTALIAVFIVFAVWNLALKICSASPQAHSTRLTSRSSRRCSA
jgi:hypothetical protein